MHVKDYEPIDISNMPHVERLVDEARQTQEPVVLYRDDEVVAEIVPVGGRLGRPVRKRTKEGREAFLAAAGSWDGLVDADQLIADIYESRRNSMNPPVDL